MAIRQTEKTAKIRDRLTGSSCVHEAGFEILHLYGTPYERGLNHGQMLREKIRSSQVAEYYGQFVRHLYRSSAFARKVPPPIRKSVGDLLEWRYYAPLERLCMEETREEIEGVAVGAGVDPRLVLRGVLAGDVLEALAVGFLKSGRQSLGNYYLGGCSSAFACGPACADRSRTYFGRNMDFPGVFVWRYPTLVFAHPTESIDTLVADGNGSFTWKKKQKQPYMYITTAGFPGFGLTGMNASGIALGTYVCLSHNIGGGSRLFLDYNHYLFTRAESIDGIEHIIRTEQPTSVSPHAVVFASDADALQVEVDSRQVAARRLGPDDDILVQTNHFTNPNLKHREIEYPLSRENSLGRYRMVENALEENYGELDEQRFVDIMAGNIDLAGKRSSLLGDFPAQPITLSSVIFELHSGDFWVAGGKPPAVCYNAYHGLNFADELRRGHGVHRRSTLTRSGRPIIEGVKGQTITESMKNSLRRVMLSQEMLKKGKRRTALRQLAAAIELYRDPAYLYLHGMLLLINQRYEEALAQFESLDHPYLFPHVKESALTLWRARTLDLLSRRDEALKYYRGLLEDGNLPPELRKATQRGLRRPYKASLIPPSFDYANLGPLLF